MLGRQARVSIAIIIRLLPHHPERSCLFPTITHYVTNQTNSQNAGDLEVSYQQQAENS